MWISDFGIGFSFELGMKEFEGIQGRGKKEHTRDFATNFTN
jgi:hypothetical protein